MRIATVVSSRLFLVMLICLLLVCILTLLSDVHKEPCVAAEQSAASDPLPQAAPVAAASAIQEPDTSGWGNHTLGVVIPFRDRFEEMLIFVPYMHRFLNQQKVKHRIYVVNQIDSYRFNRASLINVGYLHAREQCDYIAMHDVDLLPLNRNLSYRYPGDGLFHVASPEYHPRYHYPKFVGGILIIRTDHFAQVNGMSNNYWGWGLEDDEFYTRVTSAKLPIARPTNLSTSTNNTFRHIHDRRVRRRDMEKCFNQAAVTHRRDRVTGVNSVDFKVLKVNQLTIDDAAVQVLNVRLNCDRERTPWCDCSGTAESAPPAPPVNAKTSAGRAAAAPAAPDRKR